ncbi:MAG TPA: cytochrome c biogenesis protein CcdA [Anaerolineae bacterium]|nr:cytochrome c biogenesis protein CcdA [Anaerolineae bacterium]
MLIELLQFVGLGLAATASPCVLPLYPGFLAYLGANGGQLHGRRVTGLLGFFVLGGVLTMMLALGLLIFALRTAVGRIVVFITPLAGALIIVLGVLLLFDKSPFARLPQLRSPVLRNSFVSAYLYGLLYGPIAFPCSGPFLVTALALSIDNVLLNFLAFGLGFGVPLLILSLLAGIQQRRLTQLLTRHTREFNRVSGVILIVLGAVTLIENWSVMLLFLGWV